MTSNAAHAASAQTASTGSFGKGTARGVASGAGDMCPWSTIPMQPPKSEPGGTLPVGEAWWTLDSEPCGASSFPNPTQSIGTLSAGAEISY